MEANSFLFIEQIIKCLIFITVAYGIESVVYCRNKKNLFWTLDPTKKKQQIFHLT